MPIYRDEVARFTLRTIRASFKPKAFSRLKTVRLVSGPFVADIELIRVLARGLPSGWRTMMKCPRCSRNADVIGCVPEGLFAQAGWSCPKCSNWRGRPRKYSADLTTSNEAVTEPTCAQ